MKKLYWITLFYLSLTGCSRLEVAYTFADEVAISKIDDYFDLNGQQKKELKKSLQEDLDKTRLEMFPELAEKLRILEHQVAKEKVTHELIDKDITLAKKTFWKFAAYYKETSIKTLLKISPKQFTEFDEEYTESIQEIRDLEESNEKIRKRYRRNIETWIGGISKDQRKSIDYFLATHPFPFELLAQNKEHQLKQFQMVRKNPDELKKLVTQYFENYEALYEPDYVDALGKYQKNLISFAHKTFWPTVTEKQKNNLRKNLITRAEQMERMAKQTKK